MQISLLLQPRRSESEVGSSMTQLTAPRVDHESWRETLASRLAGIDPALVGPTVKSNCRVDVGAPYSP